MNQKAELLGSFEEGYFAVELLGCQLSSTAPFENCAELFLHHQYRLPENLIEQKDDSVYSGETELILSFPPFHPAKDWKQVQILFMLCISDGRLTCKPKTKHLVSLLANPYDIEEDQDNEEIAIFADGALVPMLTPFLQMYNSSILHMTVSFGGFHTSILASDNTASGKAFQELFELHQKFSKQRECSFRMLLIPSSCEILEEREREREKLRKNNKYEEKIKKKQYI